MATPGRPIDERTKRQAGDLRQRGVAVSEIARRLEMSRPTVRKILQESR